MAHLKEIVIDAWRPVALARFWEEVLDDFSIAPYDDEEIARLAAIGRTPETDPSVALIGPALCIFFQEPERSMDHQGKLHLDIVGGPREAEVTRLVALGAEVVQVHARYTKMRDPEGNEFCIQDPAGTDTAAAPYDDSAR